MGKARGYRVNVKNLKVALVTTNTSSEYEIGEIHPIEGLMTLDFSPQIATGQLYGDGELKEDAGMLTGGTLKLDANKIPILERALITGSTYKDGILDIATTDVPPAIAIYAETEASNGSKEQLWFLNCKAQPFGVSGKQREGNISYSTDTLTLGCTARKLDHKVVRFGDTEEDALDEGKSKLFENHPDMKETATASEATASEDTNPNA